MFQHLIWCNDIALGGSHHVNACIHTIDAVLWALGQRPVSAAGYSHIARDNPHGDSHDVLAVSYAFAGGAVWDHCGRHLNNLHPFESGALIHGSTGFAELSYTGPVPASRDPKALPPVTSRIFMRQAPSATSPSSTAASRKASLTTQRCPELWTAS